MTPESEAIEGEKLYGDAEKYWKEIPATVDGMLGGFSHLSSTDIAGSTKFLHRFIRGANAPTGHHRALDCGAGIGRITKRLLIPNFVTVDMVELNPDFLDKARTYLEGAASKVEHYYAVGLQNFTPDLGRYDVIWCQWVLGHLADEDFVAFFQRCRSGLAPNGVIVVKENVTSSQKNEFDARDSSFTRSKAELLRLFDVAELNILREDKQKNFPKEIYEVYMWAMK